MKATSSGTPWRKRYDQLKREGTCVRCARVEIAWERSRTMCERCLEGVRKHVDANLRRREQERLPQGRCVQCGDAPIDRSRSAKRCTTCLDRSLEHQHQFRFRRSRGMV